MIGIQRSLDVRDKLSILSRDSQYDLACACGTNALDRRHRSDNDTWIYPVTLADGGSGYLFKTLLSNVCGNNCGYCPLRAGADPVRCALTPEDIVRSFLDYYRRGRVFGLFVSSGVCGAPDAVMARLNAIGELLRGRERYRGYLHLKIIPGASPAAIERTLSLATTVSLNIETAGVDHFDKLHTGKNYLRDIIEPLRLISRLTGPENRFHRVRQTTQFIVGASTETDRDIVKYAGGLYARLRMDRIYFSAYQRGLGRADIPGEQRTMFSNGDLLTREHRLYQVDWLMRRYGFAPEEIPFDDDGNLSLTADPKKIWAHRHPELFPVNINNADKMLLLRVPGLGPTTVSRILAMRGQGVRIRSISDLGPIGKRLRTTQSFIRFG
jgi:predicted DNA-binding helix-hairpin-helix protein